MKHPILYQLVKMADIGFITILYASIGLFLAKVLEVFDRPLQKESEEKKNTFQILFEFLLMIFFIGILTYLVRTFVNWIPSPFEGKYGLDHARIKEIGNVSIFIFIFLNFQNHLQEKMQFVFDRLW
jgi:magnesium-transporting ATPase (P-type)